MNCKNILFLSIMFLVIPTWIGLIWVDLLKLKGYVSRLLHSWVLGFATILAVSQLLLVPLVALEQTLTTAIALWKAVLQILSVISFLLLLLRWKNGMSAAGRVKTENKEQGKQIFLFVFGVLAGVLILIQAYIPARYEHSDDDDSRFVAEEVSAVVYDTMYKDSPISADFMYWNVGEVRKDLTSPWAMFVAMNSKISGIAPAALSHTYLPFFLILLCYGVYTLVGQKLFSGDWEKTFLFLIFLSVIHLWGYTSTHTLASMLLLRIWQGKAVCASFILPLMFYLFCQVLGEKYEKGWIALLYVASIGACLLSGIGIITAAVLLFLYGLLDWCYYKKWRKTFQIWTAAAPCAIFMVYYIT